MFTPVDRDISIYRGAKYEETFTFTDNNNAVINLTGWKAFAQIRETQSSESELLAIFEIDTSNETNGQLLLSIESEITAKLPSRIVGYYDILLFDQTGTPQYYVQGAVRFYTTRTVATNSQTYSDGRAVFVTSFV